MSCKTLQCVNPPDFFIPAPPPPPPIIYDQVRVCNDEQTAVCPDGETGDPVTVAAGTFCLTLNFPSTMTDAERAPQIAVAKAKMNLAASDFAEAQLDCQGTGPGIYMIDGYFDGMIPNNPGNGPSGQPAWDGVFYSFSPDFFGLYPEGVWSYGPDGDFSDQGKTLCNFYIYQTGPTDWELWGGSQTSSQISNIWAGTKSVGTTPAGVYTNNGLSIINPVSPATLTVIQIPGTPTADITQFCAF